MRGLTSDRAQFPSLFKSLEYAPVSSRADGRDDGDLVTGADYCLCTVVLKINVLEVDGEHAARQNIILDPRIFLFQQCEELGDSSGRFKTL